MKSGFSCKCEMNICQRFYSIQYSTIETVKCSEQVRALGRYVQVNAELLGGNVWVRNKTGLWLTKWWALQAVSSTRNKWLAFLPDRSLPAHLSPTELEKTPTSGKSSQHCPEAHSANTLACLQVLEKLSDSVNTFLSSKPPSLQYT